MLSNIFKLALGNWRLVAGAIGLLIATHFLAYCEGRSDGRAAIKTELRAAEVKAAERSLEAIARADVKAAQNAEREAEIIGRQIGAIEKAETENENPLDSLF